MLSSITPRANLDYYRIGKLLYTKYDKLINENWMPNIEGNVYCWLDSTTPTKQMGLEERHRRPLVYNTVQQTSVLTPMSRLAEVEMARGVCLFIHAAQVQRLGKWD